MSYKVRLFQISKKINSTKIPSTTGLEYDCIIKTESGLLNPTVTLAQAPTWSPDGFNYAQIPAFGRYYWVREWTYSERCWTASLEADPLGTYKTQIGASDLYILRAANEKDEYIIDTHYPIRADVQEIVTQGNTAQWWSITDALTSGSFVVGLRGFVNSGQSSGGITYLVLTPAQFMNFTHRLFDTAMTAYISGQSLDITDTLAKMVFDPTEYIASCMWIPGSVSSGTSVSGYNVGYWQFAGSAQILNPSSFVGYDQRIYISNAPNMFSGRGKYMNGAPFTQRMVHLPRFGLVDLTGKLPANATDLVITLEIDPISGQGLYKIFYTTVKDSNSTHLIDIIQAQIGVSMPLSSDQVTIQEAVSAVTSTAAAVYDAATFNGIGAVNDMASALSVLQPHINDISQASGFLGLTNGPAAPYLISKLSYVAGDDPTEEGYPLCKIRKPNALNGYMKALHGDLAISGATIGELEQIKEYLEGGFFYE